MLTLRTDPAADTTHDTAPDTAHHAGLDASSSLPGAAIELASAIRAGATLWCVAPGFDDHARHLAVEFVHPSSVGARAVPAVAIPTSTVAEMTQELRINVRAGDVIVSMGDADSAFVDGLGLRAQAWGAVHLHIGWTTRSGSRPNTRFVSVGPDVRSERFLTRAYHLLWELTFVCLARPSPSPRIGNDDSCAVCSDEAVVAEITEVNGDRAAVRTACGTVRVDVTLVPPVGVHDLVLVHAGMALRMLDVDGGGQ